MQLKSSRLTLLQGLQTKAERILKCALSVQLSLTMALGSTLSRLQAMCSWSTAQSWDWYQGIGLDTTTRPNWQCLCLKWPENSFGKWGSRKSASSMIVALLDTDQLLVWLELQHLPFVFLISVANIPSSPPKTVMFSISFSLVIIDTAGKVMVDIYYIRTWCSKPCREKTCNCVPKWRGASTSLTWRASWSSRPPLARTSEGSPSTMTTSRKKDIIDHFLNSCLDMTSWCWWCSESFEEHLTQTRNCCSDTKTRMKILSPYPTSRHRRHQHCNILICSSSSDLSFALQYCRLLRLTITCKGLQV